MVFSGMTSKVVAFLPQSIDQGVDGLQALRVPFSARKRKNVVEQAKLCADLLAKILLLAHEFGERRIFDGGASARGIQRLLHRMTADRIGKAEGIDSPRTVAGLRVATSLI
jgi:hypothetical protein